MKDNAIKWLTELNPFDKVKGHTKIELTDVKTGKKQVIEKDNAFQAGVLASYMRSMGAYNNNPYANDTWAGQPIWRNLCGGIFCFADPIDNSGGEVEYMPAGNEMVANGAYMVNNAGTPIELGSYNEVESSTSGNDSVTFVYDWMTSQGNGTISCVCLTTEIGGYIGYGNKSGVAHSTRRSLTQNQSSNSTGSGIIYDNASWSFGYDFSTKEFSVTRTPLEISKGSIFDKIAEDTETYTYTGEITNKNTLNGSQFFWAYVGGGNILVWHAGANGFSSSEAASITPNETYYFLRFNLGTKTFTQCQITNTTGRSLLIGTLLGACAFDEQYAYFGGSGYWSSSFHCSAPIEVFNYLTGAHVTTLMSGLSTELNRPLGGRLTDEIMCLSNRIYDKTNDTLYEYNGSFPSYYQYNPELDAMVYSGCYKNPLILATINNLDTPVTKTAAQTMKITYTLTKASE